MCQGEGLGDRKGVHLPRGTLVCVWAELVLGALSPSLGAPLLVLPGPCFVT